MWRVFVTVFCLAVPTARAESHYTQQMFRRGLYEQGVLASTAPLFVLVTLRDPVSGVERAAAIPGPFLLGAIEMEYRLGLRKTISPADIHKALAEQQQQEVRIALAQPNRTFVFRNKEARDNVEPRYTPAVLSEVRHALAGKSRKKIIAATRAMESWLHRIYENKRDAEESFAYRDALAHTMLEMGILVGHGDVAPRLYVAGS